MIYSKHKARNVTYPKSVYQVQFLRIGFLRSNPFVKIIDFFLKSHKAILRYPELIKDNFDIDQ